MHHQSQSYGKQSNRERNHSNVEVEANVAGFNNRGKSLIKWIHERSLTKLRLQITGQMDSYGQFIIYAKLFSFDGKHLNEMSNFVVES